MSDQINRTVKETQRYMYEDGLFRMATGMLFLIISLGLLTWLALKVSSSALGVLLLALLFSLAVTGDLVLRHRRRKEHEK